MLLLLLREADEPDDAHSRAVEHDGRAHFEDLVAVLPAGAVTADFGEPRLADDDGLAQSQNFAIRAAGLVHLFAGPLSELSRARDTEKGLVDDFDINL